MELLFYDVHRQLVAWNGVLKPEERLGVLFGGAASEVAGGLSERPFRWLAVTLSNRRRTRFGPRRCRPCPKSSHISFYRALRQAPDQSSQRCLQQWGI